jgi:hypothetical protein
MARLPQQRAPQASDEEDFYGEGEETTRGRDEGEDYGGEGGAESDAAAEDDAALDTGEEQETGGEEDLEPRGRRADPRFQRLANERNDWRRRAEEAERRYQPPQPQQQVESEAQFEARMQQLPFEERMEARYRRDKEHNAATTQQMRLEQAVANDKAAYQSKAASNRVMKRLEQEVEDEFQRLLRVGQARPREQLYWEIRGRELDAMDGKVGVKERERAARRVQSQKTRPSNASSDVRGGGRRQLSEREARARRLENTRI